MLKPFQIRDLHGPQRPENSTGSTLSSDDLPQTPIEPDAENKSGVQSERSEHSHGTVKLSSSDYDEITSTHPRARLTYVDADDGEVITVSRSLWCLYFETPYLPF